MYFGWWWVVVGDGEYIWAGGGWWWLVVDIFWLLVGGGGWWWVVAWFSLTLSDFFLSKSVESLLSVFCSSNFMIKLFVMLTVPLIYFKYFIEIMQFIDI